MSVFFEGVIRPPLDLGPMVVVWRFYDGYEDVYAKLPDEERAVVTYIVLGSFDGTTVVCYIDGAAVGAPGSLGAAVGAPGSLGA
ncbi:MAG: hypothetical protein EB059_11305, partial [Alphaproteobacteria bacterium]|nr:hypothetical protein [Alphaproteobacteria bacterium]